MNEDHEETCASCGKKFYCFSLPGEQGHVTLSIPAINETAAMDRLGDIVREPMDWKREKKIESDIEAKTTGERKGNGPREWAPPMYG
jgi:hypothetical protein